MSRDFRIKPGKPLSFVSIIAMAVLVYFCYDAIHYYLGNAEAVEKICDGAHKIYGISGNNFWVYILGGGIFAPIMNSGITNSLMEAGVIVLAYIACAALMFHSRIFFRSANYFVGLVIIAAAAVFTVSVILIIVLIIYNLIRDIFAKTDAWDTFETIEYYISKFITILVLNAVMVIFMLAAGGKYISITKQIFSSVYASELWGILGGFFSLFMLPGVVVSYTLIHNRIIGAISFIVMIVCGFIIGFSIWWLICAVLIVLSFLCFLNENVSEYDVMDASDKICVIFPVAGASRFIDKFFLEGLFNVICKILAVLSALLAIGLPILLVFADANIEKGTKLGQNSFLIWLCGFASNYMGIVVIRVFLPLFAVLTFKYIFNKTFLAKVVAIAACGTNLYRGILMAVSIITVNSTDTVTLSSERTFGNIFNLDFSVLMVITIGAFICIYMAFQKKDENIVIRYIEEAPGSETANTMIISAITSSMVVLFAPVITGIAYIISCVLIMFVLLGMLNSTSLGYAGLRRRGLSHEEACRQCGLDPMTTSRQY